MLAEELTELGALSVVAGDAGVAFEGDAALAMNANLESRIASRILWRVATGPYHNEQVIYEAALALPWSEWMDVEQTIMVETNARRCPLRSLDFVTLRVKDAVCDHFRNHVGSRPSVDSRTPDIRISIFLDEYHFFLYLDTSGDALFRRGERVESGEAPLKKNLAAGILRIAGWRPGIPLLDPFCGAGTFLWEAAEWSLNRAAGLNRQFGFEHLKGWDLSAWPAIKAAAEARAEPARPLPLWGFDLKGDALVAAEANFEAADLVGCAQWKQVNMLESSPPAPEGYLITNPPYGERLKARSIADLYKSMGDVLKQKYAGYTAWIISSSEEGFKSIGLKPSRKIELFNGALPCSYRCFELFRGTHKQTVILRKAGQSQEQSPSPD